MVLWTTLTWILTPIFIYFYGFNGVSVASFLVTLTIVYTVYLVKKVIDFNFMAAIAKPLISAILMSVIVYFLVGIFAGNFISLIAVCIIGGLIYAACLFVISGQELKDDLVRFGIRL
jgi:O-antigen/teichoic acid export membrane protein